MFRRQKPLSDARRIWDLEKDLEFSQGSERRPLARWMVRWESHAKQREERDLLSSVDQSLRASGERGFL